jgi:hypothetical protein
MPLSFAPERIEQWPLARLQPYAKNAKVHGADQVAKIAASMAEFGWTVPRLLAEDGELIAGHGRVLAATQLGLTEAPVIVLGHLTEAQRRAYRMAAAMDKIAGSMTRGYAARSGKSKEDIAALMAAETWFDAQDALDAGLATRMAEPVRIAASSDIGRFRNAPMALAELGDAESAATGDDIVPDENDVAPATTDPAPQQQTRSPCSRNKGKVAGFHSAHSGTIPPLPWHNFVPPFSAGQNITGPFALGRAVVAFDRSARRRHRKRV